MNKNDKLNLDKMIKNNDVVDCTNDIREKKHSLKIRKDVESIINIKRENPSLDTKSLTKLCVKDASFLFTYYTDIFNRVKNNELDTNILFKFLDVMEQIENGTDDQHSGSYKVGDLLKQMYIDSALKRSEKIDKLVQDTSKPKSKSKNISWREFKQTCM